MPLILPLKMIVNSFSRLYNITIGGTCPNVPFLDMLLFGVAATITKKPPFLEVFLFRVLFGYI